MAGATPLEAAASRGKEGSEALATLEALAILEAPEVPASEVTRVREEPPGDRSRSWRPRPCQSSRTCRFLMLRVSPKSSRLVTGPRTVHVSTSAKRTTARLLWAGCSATRMHSDFRRYFERIPR